MEIYVLGRVQFDNLMDENEIDDSNVEEFKDTFFISILSSKSVPGGNFHLPVFDKKHDNVLTIIFDDVINDAGDAVYMDVNSSFIQSGKAITEVQAKEIVDFILRHQSKDYAIVHCAAGISRSGAVGAFISDMTGNKYSHFMEVNPQVHENNRVMNLLKKEYNKIN